MELQLKEEHRNNNVYSFCVDENGNKQGSEIVWTHNKTEVISSCSYINGKKHGDEIHYNKGKVSKHSVWDNDSCSREKTFTHSTWGGYLDTVTECDFKNDVKVTSQYQRGELASESTYRTVNGSSIRQEKKFHLYGSQRLHSEIKYIDGKIHGLVEKFFNNGKLEFRGRFVNGTEEGLHESWWASGLARSTKTFVSGKIDGYYVEYKESGSLSEEGYYKDGMLDGAYTQYYHNGSKWRDCTYKNGQAHGITRIYNYSGGISEICCLIEGKRYGEHKIFASTDSGRLRAHYMYLENGEKVLARKFMQDLGIPYKNLQNPSEEEKVMITLALGGGTLFCDET